MWPFRKTKRYDWKKEQGRLWRELVPAGGQADTLQGELIRIAGKLTDQAYRNGNMNWDADHERMWRFIGGKIAADPGEFADLSVHFSVLGQIHRKVKDLPPGTKISGVEIE